MFFFLRLLLFLLLPLHALPFFASVCFPTCRLWLWWRLHTRYGLCYTLLKIVCIKKFTVEWREQREKESKKEGEKKKTREMKYVSEIILNYVMYNDTAEYENKYIYIYKPKMPKHEKCVCVRERARVGWGCVKCERINTQHNTASSSSSSIQ